MDEYDKTIDLIEKAVSYTDKSQKYLADMSNTYPNENEKVNISLATMAIIDLKSYIQDHYKWASVGVTLRTFDNDVLTLERIYYYKAGHKLDEFERLTMMTMVGDILIHLENVRSMLIGWRNLYG